MAEGQTAQIPEVSFDVPPLDVAPGEVAPATGKPTLNLSSVDKDELAQRLIKLLDSHDTAMKPRLDRLLEIEDAYNLVPDSSRQGQKPDASRLVSDLLRSATNVATSQLNEALVGTKDGLIMMQVSDDQDDTEETKQAVELAKAVSAFLESYCKAEIDLDDRLYESIHALCKLGNSRIRLMWGVEDVAYTYRDFNGDLKQQQDEKGKIEWTFIPLRLAVSWPLSETNLEKTLLNGHRTFMEHFEFREFCERLEIPESEVDELLSQADEKDEGLQKDLEGKDINLSVDNAMDGQICVTELWCNMPLPGEMKKTKFYCFLIEEKQKVIWAEHNPLLYQRMGGYFDFAYWRELESIHGSGVGHESMYPQAADSSMWNMYIDNLKIIGNALRVLKAGSTAEAMRDEIGPGRDIVTEDPEGDFRVEQLGADLSEIHQGMDRNENRHMRGTGINAPTQGFADPVLKSGASPGSFMQLISQANKKFKQIDINFRNRLGPVFMFMLELFQQFAAEGLYFQHVADETAKLVSTIRFIPPRGDLSKRFRVMIRPPSAASNREGLRMNIMLIFNLMQQSLPAVLGLAQQVYGQNDPAKAHRFQEQYLLFMMKLYEEILDIHEVPGLTAEMPSLQATPQDVLTNQLFARITQMEQMINQLVGAAQDGQAGGSPTGELEASGNQPRLSGPVPV